MRDNPPPFDCATCEQQKEHNCNNRYRLIQPVIQKQGVGPLPLWIAQDLKSKLPHTGPFPPKVWSITDLYFYECPKTWITNETMQLIDLLYLEDTPTKIFPGTWLDQPKWWLEVIKIFKHETAEYYKAKNHD
jgi:hypothetical protein